MSSNKDARADEILIVRHRGHDADDHHHGGVWKIAYADFMTAMMAFFLVMWLINAANTELKASVASYFNPIKLTDNTAYAKGLRDIDKSASKEDGKGAGGAASSKDADGEKQGAEKPKAKAKDRQAAVDAHAKDPETANGMDGSGDGARAAGPLFRDPFNPLTPRTMPGDAAVSTGIEKTEQSRPGSPAPTPSRDDRAASASERAAGKERAMEAAARILGEVRSIAARVGISGGPGLDVTVEGDAIVLGLTDTSAFGMFAIGSAEPNEVLAALVRAIAPVLTANSESMIVRGHTDSRPYRNDRNNNWRLSLARAESVYGLLARAGIDERRIERIEAHADRMLKVPGDPGAAANRRIEILLRQPRP